MAEKLTRGQKSHKTTVERRGVEFVEERAREGGRKSRGGGFTGSPERAAAAARKSWANRRRADHSSKA